MVLSENINLELQTVCVMASGWDLAFNVWWHGSIESSNLSNKKS